MPAEWMNPSDTSEQLCSQHGWVRWFHQRLWQPPHSPFRPPLSWHPWIPNSQFKDHCLEKKSQKLFHTDCWERNLFFLQGCERQTIAILANTSLQARKIQKSFSLNSPHSNSVRSVILCEYIDTNAQLQSFCHLTISRYTNFLTGV